MTRALRITTNHERDINRDAGLPDAVLRVYFTFTAAVPEQGPSYASGGQPAEPEFVEFSRVEKLATWNVKTAITTWIDAPEFSEWAEAWLANEGYVEACEAAHDHMIAAREYRDQMRAEWLEWREGE